MKLVLLVLIFLVMVALNALHLGLPADLGSRSALVFGFLLIAGFIVGELFSRLALPRITGYLLAGMACGPSLLNLVDREVIDHLSLVDDLALVLIAFTAGGELKAGRLRARARSIGWILLLQTGLVLLGTMAVFWLLQAHLRFCEELSGPQFLWAIGLLALIATATSPSTAVAVILEARSKGAITDTVLGSTVLKDILVLIGFSLLVSLGLPHFDHQGGQSLPSVGWILTEVGISLGAGVVFGLLMILYLRNVQKERMLSVVAFAFLIISVSDAFHLDHLLLAMAAGFVVSNFSKQDIGFMRGLEQASAPIFLVFFCLAGAGLNLGVLLSIWQVALVYVLLRSLLTWAGTALAAMVAGDLSSVRRYAWTGFIGQAGVSLGLASLAGKIFPEVGNCINALVVGAIVFSQLVGPAAFRFALIQTGEGQKN